MYKMILSGVLEQYYEIDPKHSCMIAAAEKNLIDITKLQKHKNTSYPLSSQTNLPFTAGKVEQNKFRRRQFLKWTHCLNNVRYRGQR